MRRLGLAVLLAISALLAPAVAHADPKPRTGTIVLVEQEQLHFGDTASFITTDNLKGREYPMVYVVCYSVVDGHLLYGQLDYPDVAFLLGGGSSPWWDSDDDGVCVGRLYSYGSPHIGENPFWIADTPTFVVLKDT